MRKIHVKLDSKRLASYRDEVIRAIVELASFSTSTEACVNLFAAYRFHYELDRFSHEVIPGGYQIFYRRGLYKLDRAIFSLIDAAKPSLPEEGKKAYRKQIVHWIADDVQMLFALGNDPASAHVLLNADRHRDGHWLDFNPILRDKHFEALNRLELIEELLETPFTYDPEKKIKPWWSAEGSSSGNAS